VGLRAFKASGLYALAGLLQLLLSFLVSEASVESFVGFFPRRKRTMVEVEVRMEGKPGRDNWQGGER
jgi:hypothetical protein